MRNPPVGMENLSPQEKRDLLRRLLQQPPGSPPGSPPKAQTAEAPESAGFQFPPEFAMLKRRHEELERLGYQNIYFNPSEGINAATTRIGERELINFAGYNYLGLSGDPRVSGAASEAIDLYGTSVSASRLASGERPLHRQLEQELAGLLGTDDSLVFVGGYATNETVIGHLMGPGDLILHDSLIHASAQAGARLSGAAIRPFPHNNWGALDGILQAERAHYRQVLIIIEGVYSMDGDIPDLPRFIEVKKRHRALLLVDEAHSIGVLGDTGRGVGEHFGVDTRDVDLWMGTLSKAFASCGGYFAGAQSVIEYLRYTAPGFVYSVGMSPPNTAAALAALRIMLGEPDRLRQLRSNARLFLDLARSRSLNTGSSQDSAVIPIILGDSLASVKLYQELYDRGILALPIMYPVVPENSARLRFFVTSTHTEEQIRCAVEIVAACIPA